MKKYYWVIETKKRPYYPLIHSIRHLLEQIVNHFDFPRLRPHWSPIAGNQRPLAGANNLEQETSSYLENNPRYSQCKMSQYVTAAIDGISDCPGEPCDTSIPRIIVGNLDTKGIEGECSTARTEFKPPSCNDI